MLNKRFIILYLLCGSVMFAAAQNKFTYSDLGLTPLTQIAPIDKNIKAPAIPAPFEGLEAGKWGSPIADTLMYIFSIADIDFAPLAEEIEHKHYLQVDRFFKPVLQQAANRTMLGAQYQAKSFKADPAAKKVLVEITELSKRLVAADSRYQFVKGDYQFDLFYDKKTILGCQWEKEKYDDDYPIFVLNIFSKPRAVLADEAIYGGKYPTAIADNNKAQVWEFKGGGKTADSYERFNGIFKEGYLISGTKTFHGYGAFYDGVWSSDAWINPVFYGKYSALFTPEGSKDVIYGTFYHGDMAEFMLNAGLSTYTPNAPGWVRDAYEPYNAKRDAIIDAYKAAHSNSGGGVNYNNTNTQNSGGAAKKDAWSSCSCCGGKGYTERYDQGTTYQIKDRYGNNTGTTSSQRITCTCCHGTGK